MDIRKAIGKKIRKARRDKDISQEALAVKVNTSYTHLNQIENGNYSFLNLDLIWRISTILEVPFGSFFDID